MKTQNIEKSGVLMYFDTSRSIGSTVRMTVNHAESAEFIKGPLSAQKVLMAIDLLMQKKKVTFRDIQAISVHTGPGSFTGLRVGAAVAQMLGVLLSVHVNSREPGQAIDLNYSPVTLK